MELSKEKIKRHKNFFKNQYNRELSNLEAKEHIENVVETFN